MEKGYHTCMCVLCVGGIPLASMANIANHYKRQDFRVP